MWEAIFGVVFEQILHRYIPPNLVLTVCQIE